MAKLKKTKNELKAQREALQRYHRFLPTLELKKQQLQREVRRADAAWRERTTEEEALLERLRPWVKLLSSQPDLGAYVRVEAFDLESANIAGVTVPLLTNVRFARPTIDYFETPAWLEDAVATVSDLTRIRAEQRVLERRRVLLGEELRITAQRVNLFEKVMIPRTEENMRVIRIALGDAQTAAVARAKLAKGKGAELLVGVGGA
ncbi:MAG: V-type ATP synthase subunit D [Actinobacteria bacterium]|nr:V-type ATP synthase subunit D [Actinomycetota bacterium]